MRAASDEAAVMPGDSESVQVVSEATQHVETARESLRTLSGLFGVE